MTSSSVDRPSCSMLLTTPRLGFNGQAFSSSRSSAALDGLCRVSNPSLCRHRHPHTVPQNQPTVRHSSTFPETLCFQHHNITHKASRLETRLPNQRGWPFASKHEAVDSLPIWAQTRLPWFATNLGPSQQPRLCASAVWVVLCCVLQEKFLLWLMVACPRRSLQLTKAESNSAASPFAMFY